MVKIKMLTKGPNNNHKIGDVLEVDDERATALVKEKHAALVKK